MYPYIHFCGLTIPSYGLCMTLAIFLCCFFSIRIFCRDGGIFEDIIIIAAVAIGTGIFGGGLVYIIVTYSFDQIIGFILNGKISTLFSGGLVFYGGIIGGVAGGLISARILKADISLLEKAIVPFLPLGHAVGRIGCLLAGCCHGFEYYGIFAVKTIFSAPGVTFFPIQLVEALLNVVIAIILFLYIRKKRSSFDILTTYFLLYSIVRFNIEYFRGDEIRGAFIKLSTGQWFSVVIFVVCVIFKILLHNRKSQTDKKYIV